MRNSARGLCGPVRSDMTHLWYFTRLPTSTASILLLLILLPNTLIGGCQPGMTADFYNLSTGQAQTLGSQFPFLHGPGSLLDSLELSQSMIVPQMNFAPDSAKDLDGFKNIPMPWPTSVPASGQVAIFTTSVQITSNGYWTFYVISNSPVQFTLSSGISDIDITSSGAELEANSNTTFGVAQFSTYKLTAGSYNLVVEWHGGLPNKPATSPMLVLEYSYVSDMVVPSPSVPSSPRTTMPSSLMQTGCSPAAAPSSQLGMNPLPTSSMRPSSQPPVATDSSQSPTSGNGSFSCAANYTIIGPWLQGNVNQAVVSFTVSANQDIPVPYGLDFGGGSYTAIAYPFNIDVKEGTTVTGNFTGIVSEYWAGLDSDRSIVLGAIFSSTTQDFVPDFLKVKNTQCILSAA